MLSRLVRRLVASQRLARFQSRSAAAPLLDSNSSTSSTPVSDDSIPLAPPYSIEALLKASPPTIISDETLRKLHKLSALPYPSCSAEDMAGLVGVIEGVRNESVTKLLSRLDAASEPSIGWGRAEVVLDGWQGNAVEPLAEPVNVDAHGRALLEHAEKKRGYFFVIEGKE